MYLVIYRAHNKLHCETQYIGPFPNHETAYNYLCDTPALGQYKDDGVLNSPGVRFVQELRPALNDQYQHDRHRALTVSSLGAWFAAEEDERSPPPALT